MELHELLGLLALVTGKSSSAKDTKKQQLSKVSYGVEEELTLGPTFQSNLQ